jgi:hypothetical protein
MVIFGKTAFMKVPASHFGQLYIARFKHDARNTTKNNANDACESALLNALGGYGLHENFRDTGYRIFVGRRLYRDGVSRQLVVATD